MLSSTWRKLSQSDLQYFWTESGSVTTNNIAQVMQTKGCLGDRYDQKLADKELVDYAKYTKIV